MDTTSTNILKEKNKYLEEEKNKYLAEIELLPTDFDPINTSFTELMNIINTAGYYLSKKYDVVFTGLTKPEIENANVNTELVQYIKHEGGSKRKTRKSRKTKSRK